MVRQQKRKNRQVRGPLNCLMLALCIATSAEPAYAQNATPTNVLHVLPQTSPTTDYTKVINELVAAGKTVYLPNTGTPYLTSDALQFDVDGAGLIGQPGTTIAFNGNHTIFRVRASHITFTNITFDGSASKVDKHEAYCFKPFFTWKGGGMHYGGPTFIQEGCDNTNISQVKFDYNSSTAFTVMANDVTISNSEFAHNVGFGITATKGAKATSGATNFHFIGNSGISNGLELIGITRDAKVGEVSNNKVVGSGDNCISISGDQVRVTGNFVKGCLGHGIGVYGSSNIISGNKIIDNGQEDNPSAPAIAYWDGSSKPMYHCPGYSPHSYYGIKVIGSGAIGTRGLNNTITNNTLDDDQTPPTQGGLFVAPNVQQTSIVANNVVGRHRGSE